MFLVYNTMQYENLQLIQVWCWFSCLHEIVDKLLSIALLLLKMVANARLRERPINTLSVRSS